MTAATSKRYYLAGNRLLTHILFWIGYVLVHTGVHIDAGDPMLEYLLYETFTLPGAILVAYVNLNVLYPLFFSRKRYAAFTLSAILLLFAGSVLNRFLQERVAEPVFLPDTTTPESIWVWYMLLKSMLWYLGPVLLFTMVIRVTEQGFRTEQLKQQADSEKLQAELNLLKAQVHPHFLFNTLNNLYALTLEASARAPEVVLKLSDLMSYMLYDSRSETLALDKEIAHIRNYIALEKLRYGSRLALSLKVSGATEHFPVAPLLLLPFVENAFKHGAANATGDAWISIEISVDASLLSVRVENSCPETTQPSVAHSGIGLQNVRRRLALLYDREHTLDIVQEPGRYNVHLTLNNTTA